MSAGRSGRLGRTIGEYLPSRTFPSTRRRLPRPHTMAWHSVVQDLSVDESGVEIAPVMDNAPMDRSNSQPLSAAGTAVSLPSTVVPPKRARSPHAQRVKSPPPSGFRSPLATRSAAAQMLPVPAQPTLARNMTVAGLLHDSKQENTVSSVNRNYSYVPPNSSAFGLSPLQHGQCSLPPTTDAIAGRNRRVAAPVSARAAVISSTSTLSAA